MKLRAEDINHRRREKRQSRPLFWRASLALLLIVIAGVILYGQRDRLLPAIKEPIPLMVDSLRELWNSMPWQTQASKISNERDIIAIEAATKDLVTRAELQELLNTNFATLITKVDKLQRDVEYVGRLGRSLTKKVDTQIPALEKEVTPLKKNIENQGQQLRDLGTRLEEMDTFFQAEAEKIDNKFRAMDEELETLKQAVNDLRSVSDAQQRNMVQLEQTITILNTRLIELER